MNTSESNIFFHSEKVVFELLDPPSIKKWLLQAISLENKSIGPLNFVFCSDNYLLQLNQQYLDHNTFTDVITFNYVEGSVISGDIFISIDRVKENAEQSSTSFTNELYRVIIHGVLHLIGYNDKTDEEAQEIRAKEDFYLTLLP